MNTHAVTSQHRAEALKCVKPDFTPLADAVALAALAAAVLAASVVTEEEAVELEQPKRKQPKRMCK